MHWLQTLDVGLFRLINQSLSNPLFDAVMPWLSGNKLFAPFILLLAVFVIWKHRRKGVLCVLMIALVVPLGDSYVCNTLKHALGRVRPFAALDGVRLPANKDAMSYGTGGDGMADARKETIRPEPNQHRTSLPSSHAANWFAGAMVAWLYFRRSVRFMLPLAAAVSFSRVYNGVHYPGDVLAGAILGAGYAAAWVFALEWIWQRAGRKWFPLWHAKLPSLVLAAPKETHSAVSPDQSSREQHWLRAGYLFLAVLLVVRWVYLASGIIELSEDEAYQWQWSKHLALSYYSKPPGIAFAQSFGTALCGDNELGVRFYSPVIAATLGFLLLRFFAREVNARAGFFLVLIVSATPLLAVGATLMTVDPLSVLFWTAAMLAGWRAIREDSKTSDWLWVGLWMGLGFLSKYTELFQWLCWAVFFVLWPAARKQLRRPGPYLALLVNLVCTVPVLIWNSQHAWVTVSHVAYNAGVDTPWHASAKLIFDRFFEFLGAEAGLLNPVFFIATVWAAVAFWRRHRDDERLVYLFCMGAPLFLVYLGWTFHSRVLPNWIAPSVLPLFCVMVIYWEARLREGARRVKRFLAGGLVLGFLFVVMLHDTSIVAKVAGAPLPVKVDPLVRVRGWKEVAEAVQDARMKFLWSGGKPPFIIGAHYGITSEIAFYLPEAKALVGSDRPLVYCQSSDKPENQFFFWPGYTDKPGWSHWLKGQNAIYVILTDRPQPAPERLTREFESVTDTGLREVLYRGRVYHTIQILECRNLR